MGSAQDFKCSNCGAVAHHVSEDFDFGFSGDVTTPVVCPEHGIVQAATELRAWDEGWESNKAEHYPCPECGTMAELWDRKTCPTCKRPTMGSDPEGFSIMWD